MWGNDPAQPDSASIQPGKSITEKRLALERRLLDYQRKLTGQRQGYQDNIFGSDPVKMADQARIDATPLPLDTGKGKGSGSGQMGKPKL